MRGRGLSFYEVLGVSQTASAAEIRAAYHDLAARYHPDRHDGNALADLATEKLASLNAAYEVLSDPERRAAYDSELAQESQSQRTRSERAAPQAAQAKILRVLVVTAAFVVVVRLTPLLLRALVNLLRALGEAAILLRGTPLVALLFLVAVGGSVLVILHRTRRRREK